MNAWRHIDIALNPIALKELRQAVRGRFVVAMLVLCLLAYVLAVAAFVLTQQLDSTSIERVAAGPTAFTTLYVVLLTACIFFIPLYTGVRMMAERSDTNVDLLFITTLRPRSIIIGKLQSAAALSALLFSAALPFLMFSYVLRGVDFVSIIALSVTGFFIVLSQCVLALFVGCLPASKPFKLLLGIILFGFTISIYSPMLILASEFMRAGAATLFATPGFRQTILTSVTLLVTIDLLLMFASVAVITPPTANRALPIRVLLSTLWTISCAVAISAANRTMSTTPLTVWAVTSLSLISLVLLSAIGEREEWGRRVARTIPRAEPMRLLAFMFYSGGGGVLWAIALMIATVLVYWSSAPLFVSRIGANPSLTTRWMIEGILCVVGYAFTALLIRRRLRDGIIPGRVTWAIAMTLFIFGAVLPPLLCMSFFNNTPRFNDYFRIATMLNPFPMTDAGARSSRTAFLTAWVIIVVVANADWMKGMLARFRRTEAAARPREVAELVAQ